MMDISDSQRMVDLMQFEGVSAEGRTLIDKIRDFAVDIKNKAKFLLDSGQVLVPIYFFLVRENDDFKILMFPVSDIPSKDAVGLLIREIAMSQKVLAVVNVLEGWSIWRTITEEDVEKINNEYEGQVRLHPDAKDVVFINLAYNVNGKCYAMMKMYQIDETVDPRQVVDEKDWQMYGGEESSFRGRMIVPHQLLIPIE